MVLKEPKFWGVAAVDVKPLFAWWFYMKGFVLCFFFFFLLPLLHQCGDGNTAKKNMLLVTYHNFKLLVTVTEYMLLQMKLICAICWIMERC